MKKLFIILFATLIALASSAQTASPHLSFKGVPIDGTLNEYVQKRKQKGFDYLGTEDGIAILSGDFGKYKGKKFGDIKDDTAYLEWFVSIGKISIEEFKLLTTKLLNIK